MFDPFNFDEDETDFDMFNSYDDKEKDYEVIYPDSHSAKLTTQELYEFFIFTEHNISGDFGDLKTKLDKGITVTGDHTEWDWSMGCSNYKGKLTILRCSPPKIPTTTKFESKSSGCSHEGKYINQAGGFKFWVCPKCKKDLGDA
jgi:hypothetical protein